MKIKYLITTLYLSVLFISPIFINLYFGDKNATIYFALSIPVILYFYKINFVNFNLNKKKLFFYSDKLFFLILFIFTFISQNIDLNYETLTWDTASYLVASRQVLEGYLPFEIQWESKGPLFLYLYSIPLYFSFNNLVYFKLLNDLIIYFVAVNIFKINQLKYQSRTLSISSTLLFLLVVSKEWYVSEFSEIYVLLIFSYLFIKFEKMKDRELRTIDVLIIGFLYTSLTLINQGTILFLLPISIYFLKNKKYQIRHLAIFLSIFISMHLIVYLTYYLKNLSHIYLANYVLVPLAYSSENLSSFYELRVWIREYYSYNAFLMLAYLIIGLNTFNYLYRNKKFFDFYFLNLLIALSVYFVGSHNYYHHLFYLIFLLSVSHYANYNYFKTYKNLLALTVLVSLVSFSLNYSNKSINNLININNIQKEYPIYQLSNEIKNTLQKDNYSVFAIDYVLVLYYLEKYNFSYIVHPSNHFEPSVENTFVKLGIIPLNNVQKLIYQEPDVILCNDTLIIRGEVTKFGDFNCNITDYLKNYLQIDTTLFNSNINRDRYRDNQKKMNVFIKLDN